MWSVTTKSARCAGFEEPEDIQKLEGQNFEDNQCSLPTHSLLDLEINEFDMQFQVPNTVFNIKDKLRSKSDSILDELKA